MKVYGFSVYVRVCHFFYDLPKLILSTWFLSRKNNANNINKPFLQLSRVTFSGFLAKKFTHRQVLRKITYKLMIWTTLLYHLYAYLNRILHFTRIHNKILQSHCHNKSRNNEIGVCATKNVVQGTYMRT